MKHPFSTKILPYFTSLTGVVGFRLCAWLFAAMDEKQLLPAKHPAGTALFLLTALVLGVLFVCTRKPVLTAVSQKRLRTFRLFAAFCYILGSLCLICFAFFGHAGKLAKLASFASLAGGVTMVLAAFLKLFGKPLPFALPAVLTVALMMSTVAQCQVWGSVPQLLFYFFPLLASVFLILTAYQKTALTAGKGNAAALLFFSQGAMFFCFVSLCAQQWPLYFGMLFWSAAQMYPCIYSIKEA